jgi:hypothetical protein
MPIHQRRLGPVHVGCGQTTTPSSLSLGDDILAVAGVGTPTPVQPQPLWANRGRSTDPGHGSVISNPQFLGLTEHYLHALVEPGGVSEPEWPVKLLEHR